PGVWAENQGHMAAEQTTPAPAQPPAPESEPSTPPAAEPSGMGAPGTLIEDPSGMTAADRSAAEAEGQKTAQAQQGVWAPLSGPTFRMLWLIWMAANTCMWMNDVAAAWLMTSLT
ncbi:MFS transporter, partial [Burkholderia sola]|uniref:MFS transporter n=1 Tax=Burkholderia sola TaxID=2843302 RepID=UPI003F492EB7